MTECPLRRDWRELGHLKKSLSGTASDAEFLNRNGWMPHGNSHTGVVHRWRFTLHYFMFHIGDYHKDTAHLTAEEDLAYRRLLDFYYDSESPIPLDIAPIARRIRCQPQVVENVLKEFFKPSEAGWINKRADKEIAQYKSFSTNGKKGAAIRWGKASEDSPPIAPPIATINHKPLSNNHKLEITNHTSMVTNPILNTNISNIVEEEVAPLEPPYSPPIGRLLPPHEQAKAWAYRLQQREEAGETLTLAQKRNWREALKVKV